ncbi:MAG: hypothetical protein JNL73_14810 [Anaerolineales bacterium]|nr:hypothetical protein [Anaerolineales bacterium]
MMRLSFQTRIGAAIDCFGPDALQSLASLQTLWHSAQRTAIQSPDPGQWAASLRTQLRCALLYSTLTDLADHWTPELLAVQIEAGALSVEQAIAWIDLMANGRRRAHSVVAVAPYGTLEQRARLVDVLLATLPESGLVMDPEAWLGGEAPTAQPLSVWVSRLPEFVAPLTEAMTGALGQLLPFLGDGERKNVIQLLRSQALTLASHPQRSEEWRSIAPFRSLPELESDVAAALALPTQPRALHDDPRSESLYGLLPALAARGRPEEAWRLAQSVSPQWHLSEQLLAEVAVALPEPARSAGLSQVLHQVLQREPYWPQRWALVEIARLQARNGHAPDAVRTIEHIDHPAVRRLAQAELLPHLPQVDSDSVFDQIRSASTEGSTFDLVRGTALALATYALRTGRVGLVPPWIWAVWESSSLSARERRQGTAPVIAACGEAGLGPVLVEQALHLRPLGGRFDVLTLLARHLPKADRVEALEQAVAQEPMNWNNWLPRAEALVHFSQHLPEADALRWIERALDLSARHHRHDWEEGGIWLDTVIELAGWLPRCPTRLQTRIVDEALACAHDWVDGDYDIQVLCNVARHASDVDRRRILQDAYDTLEGLEPRAPEAHALRHLVFTFSAAELTAQDPSWAARLAREDALDPAPRRPEPSSEPTVDRDAWFGQLSTALAAHHKGYGLRADALRSLAPGLGGLSDHDRRRLIGTFLRYQVQQRSAREFVSDVAALAPLWASFGADIVTVVAECLFEQDGWVLSLFGQVLRERN